MQKIQNFSVRNIAARWSMREKNKNKEVCGRWWPMPSIWTAAWNNHPKVGGGKKNSSRNWKGKRLNSNLRRRNQELGRSSIRRGMVRHLHLEHRWRRNWRLGFTLLFLPIIFLFFKATFVLPLLRLQQPHLGMTISRQLSVIHITDEQKEE